MSETTAAQHAAERRDRWDERQRFRPYVMVEKDHEWLAGAGCPTEAGIVPMLLQLHEDGEFTSFDSVGVLDTLGWRTGKAARWVICPFPERPTR